MTLNYYFEIAKSKLFYIQMKVGVKIEKSDVGAGYQKTGGLRFFQGKITGLSFGYDSRLYQTHNVFF